MSLLQYVKAERGRAAKLAAGIGVSPVMIHQWANGVKALPVGRAPDVERATGGELPCEVTRADVTWIRVPDPAWPHPEGRPCIDVAAKAA